MIALLAIGFTLSLDNFRTAIALGGLRLRGRHAARVALAFGLCDAIAPLIGILAGHYFRDGIGPVAERAGAVALAVYGLYLLVRAWRTTATTDSLEQRWALFSLPLPLSLDNVVAGASLGLAGFYPWVAPPVFGAETALMSLAGLQLGRAAVHMVPIRADVVTGVALVIMAGVLGLGL